MFLLDTNVLSEMLKKHPDSNVLARVKSLGLETYASEVSLFEIRYGAMLRDDAEQFWLKLQHVFIPCVKWIPLNTDIHLRAADIAAFIEKKGLRVGNEDCWIAATAIENKRILVTRNIRHFRRILGLKVENWFRG